jgi:hypothetical protein
MPQHTRRSPSVNPSEPSDKGLPPPDGSPPVTNEDAAALKNAAANPGAVEIADEPPEVSAGPVVEIPAENIDPDGAVSGEPLERDPAVMTVELGRPGPHSWVALFPDRVLRTVMLAHKPQRDGSPTYLWVAPDLRRELKRDLKQVRVYLVFDAGDDGECFLWITPESDFSPYHSAVSQVLAKGDAYVRTRLFRFIYDPAKRKVEVRVRDRTADDPEPVLPSRPLGQLLPEALKAERLITGTNHPVYRALTAGGRLS